MRTAVAQQLERLARPSEVSNRLRRAAWWAPCGPEGVAAKHPEIDGLWLMRKALSQDEVDSIRALAHMALLPPSASRTSGIHFELAAAEREVDMMLSSLRKQETGTSHVVEAAEATSVAIARRDELRRRAAGIAPPPPPLRSSTAWEWFPYEPWRCMAPMRPYPERGAASPAVQAKHLAGFEVFGSAPVEEWLSLEALERQCTSVNDDARRRGVAVLRRLQSALPTMLPEAISTDAVCMFFQWQALERGSAVGGHIDAATPPADTVCTLSLGNGSSDSVRVGNACLPVTAGDIYAISGAARWDVDHEVHCSSSDRLSLTLRYARVIL